ncbi:unnamed protein product [Spirodela intermedia]|uniref:Uncharacterized protein n=1 Tax=Spirodela intermedia TaxID=51605 RepID=A0A7I8L1E5_SPIIN|nr:unnamed protein product [Spirodela intermedia]
MFTTCVFLICLSFYNFRNSSCLAPSTSRFLFFSFHNSLPRTVVYS